MIHLRDNALTSEDGSTASPQHFGLNLRESGGPRYSRSEWYHWMREFSSKKLTYRTDRLPAVSGLAKSVSRGTTDKYRAGHWYDKESFWKQLCWTVYHPPRFNELVQDLMSSERYSAPSWSWASRSQKVVWSIFPQNASPYESEIIDCEVTPKGEDITGALEGGQVIIRGKLKQVLVPPSSGQYIADLHHKNHRWTWKIELPGTIWAIYTLDWMPDPENAMDTCGPELQLRMLLLGKEGDKKRRESDEDDYYIGGLLLYPYRGQFLRVGIFLICYSCETQVEFFDDVESQVITII